MAEASARSAHLGFWWIHAALVFCFMGSIPYTRLLHSIAGSINLFFSQTELGQMVPVTLEEVEKEADRCECGRPFYAQQLLSFDACMECGRCEDVCPAFATGKPLSPKKVVQDLKGLMDWTLTSRGSRMPAGQTPALPRQPRCSMETIEADTLWSCTACSACVNVCPVSMDPLTLLTDLRRNRVSESALAARRRRPATHAIQRQPLGAAADERANWAEGTGAPTAKEKPNFEVLYWVGCAGSYDRRAQRVARAFVKLLKHADVNFAILGREEKCTGDSARRLGDEFLFQELARQISPPWPDTMYSRS